MTKEELWTIMKPNIRQIVAQWDNEGLIIETQFPCASQGILTRNKLDFYKLLVENGGHETAIESEDSNKPFCISSAVPISGEGYMYFIFDANMLTFEEANKKVKHFFTK